MTSDYIIKTIAFWLMRTSTRVMRLATVINRIAETVISKHSEMRKQGETVMRKQG